MNLPLVPNDFLLGCINPQSILYYSIHANYAMIKITQMTKWQAAHRHIRLTKDEISAWLLLLDL